MAAQGEAGLASTAESFAALLAMESGGQLSATQSKAVLARLLERGGGDPAALAKEMGFEALAPTPWPPWWTRSSRRTPTSGRRYVGGERQS